MTAWIVIGCACVVFMGLALFISIRSNNSLRLMLKKERMNRKKINEYLCLYDHWLMCKQKGFDIKDFFTENNVKSVAIYGYWMIGPRLHSELNNIGVLVDYIIDRNASNIWASVAVLSPEDDLPQVDMIVVTPFLYYEEICEKLEKKCSCPIVSIEDLII